MGVCMEGGAPNMDQWHIWAGDLELYKTVKCAIQKEQASKQHLFMAPVLVPASNFLSWVSDVASLPSLSDGMKSES